MFTNIFIIILLLILWIIGGFVVQILYALHYRNEPDELWYKAATFAFNVALSVANRWTK